MSFAKPWSRVSVAFDSSRNVGKMLNVSASASSREAVASKTLFELTIRSWSPFVRSFSASKVTPVFLISWRRPFSCSSSTSRMSAPSTAKPSRFPIASFRCWPVPPLIAPAEFLIHARNASRVGLSNAW